MCHKHLDKSVLMHLFKFPFTNTKIIIQYRLTYTPCSDLNSVPLYDVNVNIKMIKKWKIKMYIFKDLFLSLCFHKGSFFF